MGRWALGNLGTAKPIFPSGHCRLPPPWFSGHRGQPFQFLVLFQLLLLELGEKAMLLAHTHRQILGSSGGAKKGGGSREATGSFVSLGGVG